MRDVWGDPVKRDENLAPGPLALGSPFVKSTATTDKVRSEVDRLEMGLSMPQRKMDGVALTPEEYERFTDLAGQGAHRILARKMAYSFWDRIPEAKKRDMIEDTVRDARKKAKIVVMREYPRIRQAKIAKKKDEISALSRPVESQ